MQHLTARLQPIAHETALKLRHNGSGDFVMIVTPMFRRIGVARPKIGNASAADKRNPSINDQQFSVRAIIVAARIRPETGVIFHNVDAGVAQTS